MQPIPIVARFQFPHMTRCTRQSTHLYVMKFVSDFRCNIANTIYCPKLNYMCITRSVFVVKLC